MNGSCENGISTIQTTAIRNKKDNKISQNQESLGNKYGTEKGGVSLSPADSIDSKYVLITISITTGCILL